MTGQIPINEGQSGDSCCKLDQKQSDLGLHSREHVGQNLVYADVKVMKDEKDEDDHHECLLVDHYQNVGRNKMDRLVIGKVRNS